MIAYILYFGAIALWILGAFQLFKLLGAAWGRAYARTTVVISLSLQVAFFTVVGLALFQLGASL